MDVTLLGMFTEVKPLQPSKAYLLMDVTLLGMVIEVKPVHSLKAALPIDVTEYSTSLYVIKDGMVMSPE